MEIPDGENVRVICACLTVIMYSKNNFLSIFVKMKSSVH